MDWLRWCLRWNLLRRKRKENQNNLLTNYSQVRSIKLMNKETSRTWTPAFPGSHLKDPLSTLSRSSRGNGWWLRLVLILIKCQRLSKKKRRSRSKFLIKWDSWLRRRIRKEERWGIGRGISWSWEPSKKIQMRVDRKQPDRTSEYINNIITFPERSRTAIKSLFLSYINLLIIIL